MKYVITGRITGTVFIGEVEADNDEEAHEKGVALYYEGEFNRDDVDWELDYVEASE